MRSQGKKPGQQSGPGRTVPPPLPENGGRRAAVGPGQPNGRQRSLLRNVAQMFGAFAKGLIYVVIPVVLLSAIAAGVIIVRLRHGPISFDFMVPPIERGINAELVNNSVKIGGAELELTKDGSLEFHMKEMTIYDRDGDAIGGSPLAAVNISAAALWKLRIVPARVELIDPAINLVYTDADGLALEEVITAPEPKPAVRPEHAADSQSARPPAATDTAVKTQRKQFNIAKLLSDSSRRARKRLDATAYLVEFGVRNARINLDYHGRKSSLQVIEASIDFDHARRRSIISGRASVGSSRGPWALSFVTDETDKSDHLEVKATIRDLVPSTLAGAAPPLALLRMLDLPVAGDATVQLSTGGEVTNASLALEAGRGRITHPDLDEPLRMSGALLKLSFDGASRAWALHPSPVKWEGGSILFSGGAQDVAKGDQPPTWQFVLDGKNAVMEAPEFGVAAVPAEVWTARGSIVPRRGLLDIAEARFAGGGAEITVSASTEPGTDGQNTRADVKISPMPLATLKAIWPRAIAHGARKWIGEHVTAANFKGGVVNYLSGDYLKGEAPQLAEIGERLSATLEVDEAAFIPLPGMPPINVPRGLIRLENNALEISAPDAAFVLDDERRVPLKAGRMIAADVLTDRPAAEISFTSQSDLAPFLETVERLPIPAVKESAPFPKAGEGKVEADIKMKLPLVDELDADEVKIEGKAKITDGRFGKVGGQFDVQGFTLALDLTNTELTANGDLLVNGVAGKIIGQRLFGVAGDQQPPLKVTAKLDEADRNQLGLDINDIIRGVMSVEVSLQKSSTPEPSIKLKADLKDAEIIIDPVSWRKPPGKSATVEADIVSAKTGKTELQNFKVSGDDIAIEGWLAVGADKRLDEFYFPTFSLNVVSRLEVQGKLAANNIWNIKANGPTFDGRDVFRSLFSVGDGAKKSKKSKNDSRGTDLAVEIGNVIGGNDVSLRGLKMKLSTRSDKLTAFDASGKVDGGATLVAVLDTSTGQRRLLVDTVDAGQVMRLINFYPNMQNGRLRLEINLDGKGAAEKTGVLWVDKFRILGDPIVSEVVGAVDDGRPAISGRRQVTREVFDFDRMRAPFSVGYGQFVLEESYLKGPLVGANLRGKVDFKTKRMSLGGTYIPLQGLNSALGGIPLIGQILSGAHGEGIFGITFAVQGSTQDPQVLVNPLSLVAPGIFREMFQMTSQNPSVQVREDQAPAKPVEQRVRASSAPAGTSTGNQKRARKPNPSSVVDGWSSTTKSTN